MRVFRDLLAGFAAFVARTLRPLAVVAFAVVPFLLDRVALQFLRDSSGVTGDFFAGTDGRLVLDGVSHAGMFSGIIASLVLCDVGACEELARRACDEDGRMFRWFGFAIPNPHIANEIAIVAGIDGALVAGVAVVAVGVTGAASAGHAALLVAMLGLLPLGYTFGLLVIVSAIYAIGGTMCVLSGRRFNACIDRTFNWLNSAT